MQGGTLNCQGLPCKQKIVSLTRHRRPAGRDPTARRWSPKAKCFKAAAESGVPGIYFITFMFFMVKCICLSSVCSASSVVKLYWLFFVNFRAFRG